VGKPAMARARSGSDRMRPRSRAAAACFASVFWVISSDCLAAQQGSGRPRLSQEDARGRVQLLSAKQGRVILAIARQHEPASRATQDCSHLVHEIYARAGFTYPYASSFDLYAGSEGFGRVRNPQAGDLIVWPGHAGIVADPKRHRFYSLVSSGLDTSDYEAPYWRARGRPRFYRYIIAGHGNLIASTLPAGAERGTTAEGAAQSPAALGSNARKASAKEASESVPATERVDRPPAATGAAVPRSIVIAEGRKPPTREEVAAGISELSSASGSALRADVGRAAGPVIVFGRFEVTRIALKRDHGWAFLQMDTRASLSGDETDVARHSDIVRWELRRGKTGWEAVLPLDRTYVPQEVAVRAIAVRLADLTQQDSGDKDAQRREAARLTRLLGALVDENR
jgi:hypothetical protein